MNIDVKDDFIQSRHGHKLFCKYWKPFQKNEEKPKHLVFIAHGASEHCQTFDEIAIKLAQNNNFVFAHDHGRVSRLKSAIINTAGHGKSEGQRVYIEDFNIFVDDIIDHIEKIKKEYSDIPCFIIGYSMGGSMTILTTLRIPQLISGIVLIAPAIIINNFAPKLTMLWYQLVSVVYPQAYVVDIKPEDMVKDEEEIEKYKKDDLIWTGKLTAGLMKCVAKACGEINSRMKEVKIAFLLMHGTSDKICSIEGSQMFFETASSEDKTFKKYEDGYHQLFTEPNGAVDDFIEWINKR
ncbi:hypothetical protein HELRODRAFT_165793 [Helobdella robusta]|uniref:Serine aminopeptidase S33 domain-containing protein n=1 Tax=Helobdella robusta TaxID=6412 RepID=T1EXA5_HELRO|nr:hypothetical protein HELRODRAFT_165793 [Helobdella robusta]ESN91726.1 hypothetical protein HELRODRAFT_165793 [Helobdella robusta]